MLDGINTVITEMATTSEFKDGWDKLEVTIGPQQIITLSWPAWKLKVCSFKILTDSAQDVTQIETLDTLYEDGNSFSWKTNKNYTEKSWNQMEKAKVVDVVDAFLEGVWTPPWKCGHCMARLAGKYAPRY
jgi:hypothetical protein